MAPDMAWGMGLRSLHCSRITAHGVNREGVGVPRHGTASLGRSPDAAIREQSDAVVRVDAVTICGTDLHILKGDVPEVTPGRVLGHEAVGTVVEVGASLQRVAVGDRVLVSCITAGGSCRYCREATYGQCLGGGGWIL